MISITLSEVAAAVGGRLLDVSDGTRVVETVETDSRRAGPGALFVALRGEHADGHDHVAGAVEAGAAGHLTEREVSAPGAIVVTDTWRAVGELGRHVRQTVDPTVVAITGSVGKTTTKDLLAGAAGSSRRTVAARGSFNNELGVPLTLLATEHDTQLLVVEVGSRGPGHVAALMPWVQPDIAVVTAVVGVHLEQFGDLDTVARAKAELVQGLPSDGVAVLNADDPRVLGMAPLVHGRLLTCSASGQGAFGGADLRAENIQLDARAHASFIAATPWGRTELRLPLAGRHHVGNALLALAAACAAEVDLAEAAAGIAAGQISSYRSAVSEHAGVRLLNDAYNASPTSTLAALRTLQELDAAGRSFAVLGVMAEIGVTHDEAHHEVGRAAGAAADVVVVVGDLASALGDGAEQIDGAEVHRVADAAEATRLLCAMVAAGDAVLVKASRVAQLERVAAGLVTHLEDGTSA